jgi:DNA-binding NtrC family response regulator
VDLLLIHGTPVVRGDLTAWLAAAGHEVSTSISVEAAIRLLQDSPFGVLVLSLGVADAGSAAPCR